MAVSLAWYSQEASRGRDRSSTLPNKTGYPQEKWASPIPDQHQYTFPPPPGQPQRRSQRHSVTSAAPASPQQPYFQAPGQQRASTFCESPVQNHKMGYEKDLSYYGSPAHFDQKSPRSPPGYTSNPTSPNIPQFRKESEDIESLAQSISRTSIASIEPDPLPPHSNPQVLGQMQSQAFRDSERIPPLRITQDELCNATSGSLEFRISREGGKVPSMNTRPYLTVRKGLRGYALGNIQFSTSKSNSIELILNGKTTTISHYKNVLHNRWGFQSTTSSQPEKWYWKKDKGTNGAVLEDSKRNGQAIARIRGDLLTFEKARLSPETYNEVVMSAIAMAEAARRQKRKGDITDIGSAVGNFTETGGGGGTDGNNGTYSKVENVDFEIRK